MRAKGYGIPTLQAVYSRYSLSFYMMFILPTVTKRNELRHNLKLSDVAVTHIPLAIKKPTV